MSNAHVRQLRERAVDGLNIAYREAGDPANPKLVLLHGFPSSSHQYRDLIRALADRFHLIAPDYPGFGLSDTPDPATFPYTFDRIAQSRRAISSRSRGSTATACSCRTTAARLAFRLVERNPDALEWLIIQNSNAYEVGFTDGVGGLRAPVEESFARGRAAAARIPRAGHHQDDLSARREAAGAREPRRVGVGHRVPAAAERARLNLELFYDYRTNMSLYPRVAGVPARPAAEDDHLLGAERHASSLPRAATRIWRICRRRDASARRRPFHRRGIPRLHRGEYSAFLLGECGWSSHDRPPRSELRTANIPAASHR